MRRGGPVLRAMSSLRGRPRSSAVSNSSSYLALLTRLTAARRFGVRLGLSRMRALLDRLGQPDQRLGTLIHVGGTNGKGSTVAMLAALAASTGRRVATYTSPHLSTLLERIAIANPDPAWGRSTRDGTRRMIAPVPIAADALLAAAARVSEAGGDELTFFEQVTAMAMVVIADAGVDVTVLEVGLGGRLDATNVVNADCAVVTGVALDHQAMLGDSIDAIAVEKAGIWKPGRWAVVGASGEPGAVPMLVAKARDVGAKEIIVDDDAVARVPAVSLPGAHQRCNAAAAIAAMDALALTYEPRVLAEVSVPGRFERCGDLIFDGAHNPNAARALAATLRAAGVRPTLVLAMSADKDAAAFIAELAAHVGDIVATRYQQDRSMTPDSLAAVCRRATDRSVDVASHVAAAVSDARRFGAPVLVTGSLFVVGEARVAFAGAASDPIAVSDAHLPLR